MLCFDSGFGHDKSQAILPYRDLPHKPTLFFFGDGVSGTITLTAQLVSSLSLSGPLMHGWMIDMSAAKHADVLFVKNDKPAGENDLAEYAKRQGIRHVLFKTFTEALPVVQSVVKGEKSVDDVLNEAAG